MKKDLVIIGAGPAGISAAIYAKRADLDIAVIESKVIGGQIIQTAQISNYPGLEREMTGFEFGEKLKQQMELFDIKVESEEVKSVDFSNKIKIIQTEKNKYEAKAVIIASGTEPRKIGLENEEKFIGRGISFCATCDAPFFRDLPVYVVGGGNTAAEETLHIANFASEVYVIHRRDELRADKAIQKKLLSNNKIKFYWNSVIEEISGENKLDKLIIKNNKTGEEIIVDANKEQFGLFVLIGSEPNTKIYENIIALNEEYIVTTDEMETTVKGVFAAGDIRDKKIRQVVTAASDGAIAAINAEKYIEENF